MKQLLLFLIAALVAPKAFGMKPYRPDVLKFTDSTHSYELQLPLMAEGQMIKVKDKDVVISGIPQRMNPKYVMTNPQDNSLILIGGLGDSGSQLGNVLFIDLHGKTRLVELKKSIKDLEKLTEMYHQTNFPWITSIQIDAKTLTLWICKKVQAEISLSDLAVKINRPKTKPSWVPNELLTSDAKKYFWEEERE